MTLKLEIIYTNDVNEKVAEEEFVAPEGYDHLNDYNMERLLDGLKSAINNHKDILKIEILKSY